MPHAQQDMRGTRRFALRLPVMVSTPEAAALATTKDVSARGVFFYFDAPLAEGSRLEFILTLPPDITLTDAIRVRCKGRVVRVDPAQGGKVGIAAAIEEYEFLAG